MLRLSKKADYALMAMKHLAARADRGSASAREIGETYQIPLELLAKILQRLVRRGYLASHQGIRGGYRLGRPASQISIADIIEAIDGPLTITACSEGEENCDQYSTCSVRDPLWRIKTRILETLSTSMLDDLARDEVLPATPPPPSPTIQIGRGASAKGPQV